MVSKPFLAALVVTLALGFILAKLTDTVRYRHVVTQQQQLADFAIELLDAKDTPR